MKKWKLMVLLVVCSLGLSACATKIESQGTKMGKAKTSERVQENETLKLSEENPINVNVKKGEIRFLNKVNGTYMSEKTIHGISAQSGSNGSKAIMSSYATARQVYNGLKKLKAKPGDNLTTASKKGAIIEGSMLEVTCIIKGKEVPIEKTVLIDGQEVKKLDFRFGGNLKANEKAGTGCILCYNSCPLGIISPTEYGFGTGANTTGNAKVLPKDGSDLEVVIRLADCCA